MSGLSNVPKSSDNKKNIHIFIYNTSIKSHDLNSERRKLNNYNWALCNSNSGSINEVDDKQTIASTCLRHKRIKPGRSFVNCPKENTVKMNHNSQVKIGNKHNFKKDIISHRHATVKKCASCLKPRPKIKTLSASSAHFQNTMHLYQQYKCHKAIGVNSATLLQLRFNKSSKCTNNKSSVKKRFFGFIKPNFLTCKKNSSTAGTCEIYDIMQFYDDKNISNHSENSLRYYFETPINNDNFLYRVQSNMKEIDYSSKSMSELYKLKESDKSSYSKSMLLKPRGSNNSSNMKSNLSTLKKSHKKSHSKSNLSKPKENYSTNLKSQLSKFKECDKMPHSKTKLYIKLKKCYNLSKSNSQLPAEFKDKIIEDSKIYLSRNFENTNHPKKSIGSGSYDLSEPMKIKQSVDKHDINVLSTPSTSSVLNNNVIKPENVRKVYKNSNHNLKSLVKVKGIKATCKLNIIKKHKHDFGNNLNNYSEPTHKSFGLNTSNVSSVVFCDTSAQTITSDIKRRSNCCITNLSDKISETYHKEYMDEKNLHDHIVSTNEKVVTKPNKNKNISETITSRPLLINRKNSHHGYISTDDVYRNETIISKAVSCQIGVKSDACVLHIFFILITYLVYILFFVTVILKNITKNKFKGVTQSGNRQSSRKDKFTMNMLNVISKKGKTKPNAAKPVNIMTLSHLQETNVIKSALDINSTNSIGVNLCDCQKPRFIKKSLLTHYLPRPLISSSRDLQLTSSNMKHKHTDSNEVKLSKIKSDSSTDNYKVKQHENSIKNSCKSEIYLKNFTKTYLVKSSTKFQSISVQFLKRTFSSLTHSNSKTPLQYDNIFLVTNQLDNINQSKSEARPKTKCEDDYRKYYFLNNHHKASHNKIEQTLNNMGTLEVCSQFNSIKQEKKHKNKNFVHSEQECKYTCSKNFDIVGNLTINRPPKILKKSNVRKLLKCHSSNTNSNIDMKDTEIKRIPKKTQSDSFRRDKLTSTRSLERNICCDMKNFGTQMLKNRSRDKKVPPKVEKCVVVQPNYDVFLVHSKCSGDGLHKRHTTYKEETKNEISKHCIPESQIRNINNKANNLHNTHLTKRNDVRSFICDPCKPYGANCNYNYPHIFEYSKSLLTDNEKDLHFINSKKNKENKLETPTHLSNKLKNIDTNKCLCKACKKTPLCDNKILSRTKSMCLGRKKSDSVSAYSVENPMTKYCAKHSFHCSCLCMKRMCKRSINDVCKDATTEDYKIHIQRKDECYAESKPNATVNKDYRTIIPKCHVKSHHSFGNFIAQCMHKFPMRKCSSQRNTANQTIDCTSCCLNSVHFEKSSRRSRTVIELCSEFSNDSKKNRCLSKQNTIKLMPQQENTKSKSPFKNFFQGNKKQGNRKDVDHFLCPSCFNVVKTSDLQNNGITIEPCRKCNINNILCNLCEGNKSASNEIVDDKPSRQLPKEKHSQYCIPCRCRCQKNDVMNQSTLPEELKNCRKKGQKKLQQTIGQQTILGEKLKTNNSSSTATVTIRNHKIQVKRKEEQKYIKPTKTIRNFNVGITLPAWLAYSVKHKKDNEIKSFKFDHTSKSSILKSSCQLAQEEKNICTECGMQALYAEPSPNTYICNNCNKYSFCLNKSGVDNNGTNSKGQYSFVNSKEYIGKTYTCSSCCPMTNICRPVIDVYQSHFTNEFNNVCRDIGKECKLKKKEKRKKISTVIKEKISAPKEKKKSELKGKKKSELIERKRRELKEKEKSYLKVKKKNESKVKKVSAPKKKILSAPRKKKVSAPKNKKVSASKKKKVSEPKKKKGSKNPHCSFWKKFIIRRSRKVRHFKKLTKMIFWTKKRRHKDVNPCVNYAMPPKHKIVIHLPQIKARILDTLFYISACMLWVPIFICFEICKICF